MIAVLVLGTNIGDRVDFLLKALDEIRALGRVIGISGLYLSKPFGYECRRS